MPAPDRILDRLLDWFNEDNPVEVVLMRSTEERTTAGGTKKGAPFALPPQPGRIVLANKELINRTLPNGQILSPEATLVLRRTADIERGDTFTVGEDEYKVVFVTRLPWSTQGDLIRHAS